MSRKCDLTGAGVAFGNNVSHSKRATRRRFGANIIRTSLKSEASGCSLRLKLSAKVLRTIDYRGSLDDFLLRAKSASLTPFGKKLKKVVHLKAVQSTKE